MSMFSEYNTKLENFYSNHKDIKIEITDSVDIEFNELKNYRTYYIMVDQKYYIVQGIIKKFNNLDYDVVTMLNFNNLIEKFINDIEIPNQYHNVDNKLINNKFSVIENQKVSQLINFYYNKDIDFKFNDLSMLVTSVNKYFNLNLLKNQIENSAIDNEFLENRRLININSNIHIPYKISKVYYINLDFRDDRRTHIEDILSEIDILKKERFSAIRPTKEDLVNVNGKYHKYYRRGVIRFKRYLNNKSKIIERGLGAFGCYLSHYFLLHKIKKDHIGENILILEDDAQFDQNLISSCENVIKNELNDANIDWDIIRVVWKYPYPKMKQITPNLFKYKNTNKQSAFGKKFRNDLHNGTTFQIINVRNIKKILNYLDSDKIYNIDGVYSTNKINAYVFKYPIKITANFTSDIPKVPLK